LKRALKTGRYPVLRGDIDNPHKKAQRIRELHQFKDEVTATLRAQKYEQESKSNPLKRLKTHNKAYKRVMRHGYRKEPLSRAIVQEGPKRLEEIIPKDSGERPSHYYLEAITRSCKFCCRQYNDQSRGSADVLLSQIQLHVPAAEHRKW